MFYVTINEKKLLVFHKSELTDWSIKPLELGHRLYVDSYSFNRGELYKIMGYKTIDFAYPHNFNHPRLYTVKDGKRVRSNENLVWSYERKDGKDSTNGYPIWDKDVLIDLANVILEKLAKNQVEFPNLDDII